MILWACRCAKTRSAAARRSRQSAADIGMSGSVTHCPLGAERTRPTDRREPQSWIAPAPPLIQLPDSPAFAAGRAHGRASIDENLMRHDLSPAQEAAAISRRKARASESSTARDRNRSDFATSRLAAIGQTTQGPPGTSRPSQTILAVPI